jgi:hypothetical protein
MKLSSFASLVSLLGSAGLFPLSTQAQLTCGEGTTLDSDTDVCLCESDLAASSNDTKSVYIAGLFDTENFDWGREIFETTCSLINNHSDGWNDDILNDGTVLKCKVADTKCDGTVAARAYWDLRKENGGVPMHGIVGARCSGASITLVCARTLYIYKARGQNGHAFTHTFVA